MSSNSYPYTLEERNNLLRRVTPEQRKGNYSPSIEKLISLVEQHNYLPSITDGYKVECD